MKINDILLSNREIILRIDNEEQLKSIEHTFYSKLKDVDYKFFPKYVSGISSVTRGTYMGFEHPENENNVITFNDIIQ